MGNAGKYMSMDNGAKAAKEPSTIAIHNRLERVIVPGLSTEFSKEEPKVVSFPSLYQLFLIF
jgi:hypothetical protein